jgi:hypothetical protein
MEKYDSVIIAIAIIMGAVIVGGALLFSSTMFNMVLPSITISDDNSTDNSTVMPSVDNNAYLKPVNGSKLKEYQASCVQLKDSIIPMGWDTSSLVGKKVKCTGKIVSILSNSSNSSDIIVQVPEITKYPFMVVTYGDGAPFNPGTTINIFGEYSDLASIPDPNSGEYKMVPMIKAVYLEKV